MGVVVVVMVVEVVMVVVVTVVVVVMVMVVVVVAMDDGGGGVVVVAVVVVVGVDVFFGDNGKLSVDVGAGFQRWSCGGWVSRSVVELSCVSCHEGGGALRCNFWDIFSGVVMVFVVVFVMVWE